MQSQGFAELERRASLIAEGDQVRKLESRSRVYAEIEAMKAEGKAFELTPEEERMLQAFRRFKATCKPGKVFTWQTRPEEGVIVAPEQALIVSPEEERAVGIE